MERHVKRFKTLSETLDHYGVEHEGRHIVSEQGDVFEKHLLESKEYGSRIHFRSPFVHVNSEDNVILTDLVERLRARDALSFKDGKWWPENHLYLSLPKFFSLYNMPIDLRGGALILGSGGRARTSVAVLSQLGVKRVTMIDTDMEGAERAVARLRKNFWGSQIEHLSHKMLTHLPGVYSIVINGLPRDKEAELKGEISYFNFLISSGIYIDLKSSSDPELMDEAKKVGARMVFGDQITSLSDAHWLKESFGLSASLREISDHVQSKAQKA